MSPAVYIPPSTYWSHGTADPTGGSNGDYYLKTDGTNVLSVWKKVAGTWVNQAAFGTGSGGGGGTVDVAVTGTQNGSNKVFTLGSTITGIGLCFFNGQLLTSGASNDYTVSGTTLTFTANRPAPLATDVIRFMGYTGAANAVPNGGTTAQVLSKNSNADGDLVWVSGIVNVDTPPSVPNAKNDEFTGANLDPKWTLTNQRTSTYVLTNGSLVLTAAGNASGAFNNFILTQPAPAGSFTASTKVSFENVFANYRHLGLIFRNSTTGKSLNFSYGVHTTYGNPMVILFKMSSATAESTDVGGTSTGTSRMPLYLRAVYNGTTIVFQYALEGLIWYTIATETLSTFLTSFDQVGVIIDSINASGTAAFTGAFEFFRIS